MKIGKNKNILYLNSLYKKRKFVIMFKTKLQNMKIGYLFKLKNYYLLSKDKKRGVYIIFYI